MPTVGMVRSALQLDLNSIYIHAHTHEKQWQRMQSNRKIDNFNCNDID